MIDEYIHTLMEQRIQWKSAQGHSQYNTVLGDKTVIMKLNNFPDEPLCTITIGSESKDMDVFPRLWTLPGWPEENSDKPNVPSKG